jgi:hypothetical protein
LPLASASSWTFADGRDIVTRVTSLDPLTAVSAEGESLKRPELRARVDNSTTDVAFSALGRDNEFTDRLPKRNVLL